METLNDYEEKTLRAFAGLIMEIFDGGIGVVRECPLDLATEELELIAQVEAIVASWEDDGDLAV